MSWFEFLSYELEEIKDEEFIDPGLDLEPGDEVVGEMSAEQRRLYTLAQLFMRLSAEATIEVQFGKTAEERAEAIKKAVEFKTKAEVLMDIMWVCVKDEIGLWDKTKIGIRKNFKVIIPKPKPASFLDFLKNMD